MMKDIFEIKEANSAIPTGLNVYCRRFPPINRAGYFQLSLRDKKVSVDYSDLS